MLHFFSVVLYKYLYILNTSFSFTLPAFDAHWEHIQVLRVACSASPTRKVHPITGTLASELTQEDTDRFLIKVLLSLRMQLSC